MKRYVKMVILTCGIRFMFTKGIFKGKIDTILGGWLSG